MATRTISRFTDRILAAMRRGRMAGAVAAALVAGGLPAWAQDRNAESAVTRTYLNKTNIDLPIEIDNSYRTHISSLVLYAKEGPTGTWTLRDKAAPNQQSFAFRAPKDGEYWFRIVAIDNQGKSHPDDLSKDPQDNVVVVIDTTPPALEVNYRANAAEGQIVQCDIRDPNVDLLKLRFFYQTRDQVWRNLESLPDQPTIFCVPTQAALTNFVRVVAVDMAGNSTARTYNLSELATKAAQQPRPPMVAANPSPAHQQQFSPTATVPPGTALSTPNTAPVSVPIVSEPSQPIAPPTIIEPSVAEPRVPAPQAINYPAATVAKTPSGQPAPGPSLEPSSEKVVPAELPATLPLATSPISTTPAAVTPVTTSEIETTSGTLAKAAPTPAVQLVGTHQVFLNYAVENIGASGVGKLEIYATRDRGQTWNRIAEDSARKNPVEVNLPGEGIFGLKAVVSNGRGFGAAMPQAGDPSDWWIEVDTTKPAAKITGIRSGVGQEAGSIYVFWQAEDKNLTADSAELFVAQNREGPWNSIARNLKNSGEFRWQPPLEAASQAYIRLIVRDKVGNIGLSETTQPVPLDDLSRPRVRLIGVTAPQALNAAMPAPIQPVQATSTPVTATPGGGSTTSPTPANNPQVRPATYIAPGIVEVR
jgi:hypothetical protein